MMHRRDVLSGFALSNLAFSKLTLSKLALGTLATLGAFSIGRDAQAQINRRVQRVGIMSLGDTADMAGTRPRNPYTRALMRGLRELGLINGRNIVAEPRGFERDPARYAEQAAEMVARRPDVIVASSPMLAALRRATTTIPIVMVAAADPVDQGFVKSLARPGTNMTGLSLQSNDTVIRRLDVLMELVVPASTVAVLWDGASVTDWQAVEARALARGWKPVSLQVRDAAGFEPAFKAAVDAGAAAVMVLGGNAFFASAARIADLAQANRLPAMYGVRPYIEAGGLAAYGADISDLWWRAAGFVDRILKGAQVAEMSVEAPTRFELVLNLKAAKAIGLTLPQSVTLRADVVIE